MDVSGKKQQYLLIALRLTIRGLTRGMDYHFEKLSVSKLMEDLYVIIDNGEISKYNTASEAGVAFCSKAWNIKIT